MADNDKGTDVPGVVTGFDPPPWGEVSQWVSNLRALQRPFVVTVLIVGFEVGLLRGVWNGPLNWGQWLTVSLAVLGPVLGFLFGERSASKAFDQAAKNIGPGG